MKRSKKETPILTANGMYQGLGTSPESAKLEGHQLHAKHADGTATIKQVQWLYQLHNVAGRRDGRTMVLFLKAKKEIPDKANAA